MSLLAALICAVLGTNVEAEMAEERARLVDRRDALKKQLEPYQPEPVPAPVPPGFLPGFPPPCRAGSCGEVLRAGESCSEEPNRCAADTRCDLSSATCVPLAPAGASCSTDFDCLHPLQCSSGVCRQPGALGEPCSAAAFCAPTRRCVDGQCVTSARECH